MESNMVLVRMRAHREGLAGIQAPTQPALILTRRQPLLAVLHSSTLEPLPFVGIFSYPRWSAASLVRLPLFPLRNAAPSRV
jgi:hypothetical protein